MRAGPLRVLFVCAGNTCRSPMAEALLRQMAADAGLADRIEAHSAGISARPGDPVNPAALAVLAAHGIRHAGQARRFETTMCADYRLIIPLDRATLAAVEAQCAARHSGAAHRPGPTVRLLMAFAPGAGTDEVFDPYGTDRYPEAFALIRQGVGGVLAALRKELEA